MALTGPQKFPGASTAYWYQRGFPGSAMETNVIVWHSTEGTSLPSYSGGAVAPNLTAVPDFGAKRIRWYQHFDFDVSSRALRNLAGGVETNTANVCQVEVVGTCDPSAHRRWGGQHLYMPELPDWAVRDLAAFAKWAHEQHGVPLKSGLTFKPYPASYGANGVRLTGSQWRNFYGHCGHQHVPENDHGDPGAFPMAPILARAKGDTPQETDMPETVGRTDDGKKSRAPGEWKALSIDGVDLIKGAAAYYVQVKLNVTAAAGGTLQGRFYHSRPDGTRWVDVITERITTAGKSFVDFSGAGDIKEDESLRFELAYFPARSGDTAEAVITRSRVRGLYWKA
jgi:hypothetical protein